MSRITRMVVPEVMHHITQQGNWRLQTFFCDEDYEAYIDLMSPWCTHLDIEVWAYCLMPNNAHLIAVPPSEKALSQAIGEAHRRYTRRVNFRAGWRGHLWLRCLRCLASGMISFPVVYRMKKSKSFDVMSEPGDLLARTVL